MADSKITFILAAIDRGASRTANKVGAAIGGIGGVSRKAAGLVRGLGLALLQIGTAVVVAGIVAVTAAMANAVRGAIEEEKGIARLDAALKANVKGWNGNTTAIEKAIDKRMKLAFTDDELRQSLGTLVTGLGDVDEALAQQAIAMDIARLKNISLDEASKILVRAQNGNTRALKELGLVLPKTATKTEILAAIQKKAAGQAEAYGNTTSGAFQKFHIALAELLEDVAVAALPLLTEFASFLSDNVVPAVSGVITTIRTWVSENQPLIRQVAAFAGGVLTTLVTAIGNVINWIGMLIGKITSNKDAMNFLKMVVGAIAIAFDLVTTAIGFMLGKVGAFIDAVTKNKVLIEAFKAVIRAIAAAFTAVRDAIGFTLGKLRQLGAWINANGPKLQDLVNLLRFLPGPGAQFVGLGLEQRAAGGPVRRDSTYLVGEKGPELFRPSSSGTIIPNSAMGGGGTQVIQLVVDGRVLAEVVDRQLLRTFQRGAQNAARV